MRRRPRLELLATLAALGGVAACAGDAEGPYFGTTSREGKDAATFYSNNGTEPEYLDPGKSNDGASAALILQLFEGLTAFHPEDLRPTQGVAERWDESADKRHFRFYLRRDAKWSDGVPVTAHDFEYAWKRVLRPQTASRAAPNLYLLKNGEAYNRGALKDEAAVGVRALDDHTLAVELEQPTPYFTDLTSSANLLPVRRDVIEKFERAGQADLWFRPENIVVNGPYTLDTWKFRYEITMKRNPHYWDRERLKIHRLVWLLIDDIRGTLNLYKAAEIDHIGDNVSLPSEYMDMLSTKKDFRRYPYLSTYWYDVNTKKPPVNDARVRWALNLAIDKGEIVRRVTRAGQVPATHYVPDFTGRGYSDQVAEDRAAGVDPFSAPDVLYNPERARALLGEAGYPVEKEGDGYRASGFPPLEILYNTSEGHRNIAVAVQSMWKQNLGVSVTLRNEEWKVMLKSIRDGQFQVARGGMTGNYDHPHTWLDMFLSYSPQNGPGWVDKEYDALIKAALVAPDKKESIRLYRKAEERAVVGMSRLPLYFFTKSTLVKPWVKGFYGASRNARLMKWLWIDPAWRESPGNEPAFAPLEVPEPGRLSAP